MERENLRLVLRSVQAGFPQVLRLKKKTKIKALEVLKYFVKVVKSLYYVSTSIFGKVW